MWRPQRACEHEADVRELARSNADAPALRGHVATCPACRETLAVATWMRRFAALPAEAPPLPNPIGIWLRAEMLRRWDAQRKAESPIEVGERIQAGVGLLGAAALLVWLWSRLHGIEQPAALQSGATIMLIVSAVLLAGTASFLARQVMPRDE